MVNLLYLNTAMIAKTTQNILTNGTASRRNTVEL